MNPSQAKQIERRPLDSLKPHPRQFDIFIHPPQSEIEELASDMRRNGLLTPIETLPDGTIIAGHKRTAAARHLGWSEVDVWVRHDLAEQPAFAERRLIEDNLNRRQLDRLERARCYRALRSLESRSGELTQTEKGELRDQIGKRLGMSGRNLDRHLRVLQFTPRAVQDAVSADKLGITLAEKVAGLTNAEKEAIATAILGGCDPPTIVRKYVTCSDRRSTRNLQRLLNTIERSCDELLGVGTQFPDDIDMVLGRLQSVLDSLRAATSERRQKKVTKSSKRKGKKRKQS